MAIEAVTYDLLHTLNERFPRSISGDVAILGDCRFYLPDVADDNHKALERFALDFGLRSAVSLDVTGNPTFRRDLHEPVSQDLRNRFDLVIDAGTMSFCFNVPLVWQNILEMLRDTGHVFHLASLTGYFGRAYYGLPPKLFRDFYGENGFDILYMAVRSHLRTSRAAKLLARWKRWRGEMCGGYAEIGKDDVFLRCASSIEMEFAPEFSGFPQIVPNDSTIVCFARRRERLAFRNVVPKPDVAGG